MLIDEVYGTICQGLAAAHKDLMHREDKAEKDQAMLGSVPEQKQEELAQAKRWVMLLLVGYYDLSLISLSITHTFMPQTNTTAALLYSDCSRSFWTV